MLEIVIAAHIVDIAFDRGRVSLPLEVVDGGQVGEDEFNVEPEEDADQHQEHSQDDIEHQPRHRENREVLFEILCDDDDLLDERPQANGECKGDR